MARCQPTFTVFSVANHALPPEHEFIRSAAIHGHTVHFAFVNKSTRSPLAAKPGLLLQYLRLQCPRSVVLMVDAFDSLFLGPASTMLQHFQESGHEMIFAAEKLYSDQRPGDRHFFDELAAKEATRYLNSGGVIGYAESLNAVAQAAVQADAQRQMECGQPVARRCTDQWVYGYVLARGWAHWHASLDYRSRFFFTASGEDWSLANAKSRVAATHPYIVHMPFRSAPLVNATWRARPRGSHPLRPSCAQTQPCLSLCLSYGYASHKPCLLSTFSLPALVQRPSVRSGPRYPATANMRCLRWEVR